MTVHFAPSTACNLGCTYCYQTPDRARKVGQEKVRHHYDVDKVLARLEQFKEDYPGEMPGFHGGEPLLMPIEDLETVMVWIYENYGEGSHIQTNGSLITDDHIALFKQYGVGVGISCDGPPELNRERRAANDSDRTTDAMTVRTLRNITKLRAEGVNVGLIVVVSDTNAGTDEKLTKLLNWMDNLNRMGVQGHYNAAIPYEDIQTDISLSPARLAEVYVKTWEWMTEPGQSHRAWDPMRQAVDNLLGLQLGNCVMDKCDIYNAGAAKIVLGDGETTGCGKTWEPVGDGVPFLQGPSNDSEYNDTEERYEMLMQVPGGFNGEPDLGGCKGCPYWNVCHGGCPSAGAGGDFRNRTVFCEAVYALYERIEEDLRALMPQVNLMSDLPWNADASSARQDGWTLDPFAAAKHPEPGGSYYRPSVGKASGPNKSPMEGFPRKYLPEESFEERVERVKKDYNISEDDPSFTADRETGNIHIDTAGTWERVEDSEEDR